MHDYRNLLILSYFLQYKGNYSLLILQNKLGLTLNQLEDRLYALIDEKYLIYENNLLTITTKGITTVLGNNMEVFPFDVGEDEQIKPLTNNIDKLDIEDIYIPNNFIKKLGK